VSFLRNRIPAHIVRIRPGVGGARGLAKFFDKFLLKRIILSLDMSVECNCFYAVSRTCLNELLSVCHRPQRLRLLRPRPASMSRSSVDHLPPYHTLAVGSRRCFDENGLKGIKPIHDAAVLHYATLAPRNHGVVIWSFLSTFICFLFLDCGPRLTVVQCIEKTPSDTSVSSAAKALETIKTLFA
jgi:hypothetical protein